MEQVIRTTPSRTSVVVTNVLMSGAAFASRMDDGGNCYIPVNVANAISAQIGDELTALVVPNRYSDKVHQTPWLAVHLSRPEQGSLALPPTQPQPITVQPALSVHERVFATMQKGGVWTVATMFEELFPSKTRAGDTVDYGAVSNALRKMFVDNQCAKFSMYRSSAQTKASREWFTCYPEKADVDEWEE